MQSQRYHRLRQVLERRQPDLTVLMESVHKPHNLSAILRNCDAVGVLEAHAVPPADGLEIHHDTSGGTSKWIPVHEHRDVAVAVEALHDRGFQVLAADPAPGARDYREVDFTAPTAVMLGSELYGVSDRGRTMADGAVMIPMRGMVRSLNVSVATAILLFEAARQREAAGMYRESRLDPAERERLLFEWGYPRIARRLRELGEPYPELDDEGSIVGELPRL